MWTFIWMRYKKYEFKHLEKCFYIFLSKKCSSSVSSTGSANKLAEHTSSSEMKAKTNGKLLRRKERV